MKLIDKTRVFTVRYSHPYVQRWVVDGNEKSHAFMKNATAVVAAPTVAIAAALVQSQLPNAVIHSVNPAGGGDDLMVLVDDAALLIGGRSHDA